MGEEAHRRSRPLLRPPIHNHHLHDIFNAHTSGTCDMGYRRGGFTSIFIVGASVCTYWAGLARCKSVLKLRAERMHLHFFHSVLGTSRTQLVLDVIQDIPAAGMYNHSCLMRRSYSRVLSSVFKSPDLCHQSKHRDFRVCFFFRLGSSRHKYGVF